MKDTEIFYKIVRKYEQELFSYVDYVNSKYTLKYKVGEITLPKIANSKIFIFKELIHVQRFLNAELGYDDTPSQIKLFTCEAENATPLNHMAWMFWQFENFWKIPLYNSRITPRGTWGADSITLLEEIPLT
jgi:hypothetical protein